MIPCPVRPPGPLRVWLPLLLTVFLALLAVCPARAQVFKPWSPPPDSLTRMAHSALLRFQRQKGDSVVGSNFDGYEVVGDMARKMFASLGKTHLPLAQAVESTLDSLGLDVEVRTDPQMKSCVFMLVRNPYRPASDAVGYLYWLYGPTLRMQGASYPPSADCSVRFWYTGREDVPYEAITLYRQRNNANKLAMRLYRMNSDGVYWELVQYEGHAPDLGTSTDAAFTDVNRDGLPELVAFHTSEPDSFLKIATDAPALVDEYLFTERPEGFVLHDLRTVPGPSETVNLFVNMLVNRETDMARRLLVDPAAAGLDSMLAHGWGRFVGRGDWFVEYGEAQPWPEWLELRIRQDDGLKHYIFHFWIKDGRWVIKNWIPVQPASPSVVRKPDPLPPRPGAKVKRP